MGCALGHPARVIAPLTHALLQRRIAGITATPDRYADPWGVIGAKWPQIPVRGPTHDQPHRRRCRRGASGIGKAVAQ